MVIRIGESVIRKSDLKSYFEMELKDPLSIRELVTELEIKNEESIIYILNGEVAKDTEVLSNNDRLSILNVLGGG